MTVEPRPLLAFDRPHVEDLENGNRSVKPPQWPSPDRQGKRLTPQFQALQEAFEAERVQLSSTVPPEPDPELVVVFDLVGSVQDFYRAVEKVEGMHFLLELLGEEIEADDEFFDQKPSESAAGSSSNRHPTSLYLTMANARAVEELISHFNSWQKDPKVEMKRGLSRFKSAFEQLRSIRKWGPLDRIRETRLEEDWEERLVVAGGSFSPVHVEIELWWLEGSLERRIAEDKVLAAIKRADGKLISKAEIPGIQYHALLVEVPIQMVDALVNEGVESIELLRVEQIMFVSPFTPMSISPPASDSAETTTIAPIERLEGEPIAALLDGLPLSNHEALQGRIILDHPTASEAEYTVAKRQHGTHMASVILHGDLNNPGPPLTSPLYVRPIMKAHDSLNKELIDPTRLLPDLLHQAIRRIVVGDGSQPAAAPSVRVINLSIGAADQSLVRRVSPVGRLLDWLAVEYNLLFIVSAGNHPNEFTLSDEESNDLKKARRAVLKQRIDRTLLRGILPPGDSMNALTVGALYDDDGNTQIHSDIHWSINEPGEPAFYSATGPGPARRIKPDLHHVGGQLPFQKPATSSTDKEPTLRFANTLVRGPGVQVAVPRSDGTTTATGYTAGTSVATALVTRQAVHLFEKLASLKPVDDALPLPTEEYHPLLVRALLVHSSSWEEQLDKMATEHEWEGIDRRKKMTSVFGFGRLDTNRLGTAATNRALLLAGDTITPKQQHTYQITIPPSLKAKVGRHRLTVTLAYAAPTTSRHQKYRTHKVWFSTNAQEEFDFGNRREADADAAQRGSLQHEIFEGTKTLRIRETSELEVRVHCANAALTSKKDAKPIRYALVVSLEANEEVSNEIYEEIRQSLVAKARGKAPIETVKATVR